MNPHTTLSVLIADDEESIRQGLLHAVKWDELNATVTAVVPNGSQAFEYIEQFSPDIAIIDINMPGLTGLEVIKQVTELKLNTQFIILSGYNDFSYAQQAVKYGVKSYLLKPLNLQDLTDELLSLSATITQRKSINADLKSLQSSSRLHILTQLIHGESYQISDLSNRIRDLRMHITDSNCRVIVCSIQNPDKLEYLIEEAVSLIAQSLSDISCEVWSPNPYQIAIIVNDNTSDDHVSINIAKRCLTKLSAYENSLLGIGIGDLVTSLARVDYSYNRGLLALSYQIYQDTPAIHTPASICNQAPAISPASIDYSAITKAIIACDEDEVLAECENFFQTLFYVPEPPPSFSRSMCIYLTINVLKELNEKMQPNFSFPEITYEELNQLITFTEIKEWIIKLLKDCCNTLKALPHNIVSSSKDPIIEACKAYVQEHIESNMKTKDIANCVNLSDSYCAAYFKSKTGTNLRDYILGEKMNYAKKLMDEKNIQISEIAYKLGYTDYRSFSRAFKNLTGLSPSEYSNK